MAAQIDIVTYCNPSAARVLVTEVSRVLDRSLTRTIDNRREEVQTYQSLLTIIEELSQTKGLGHLFFGFSIIDDPKLLFEFQRRFASDLTIAAETHYRVLLVSGNLNQWFGFLIQDDANIIFRDIKNQIYNLLCGLRLSDVFKDYRREYCANGGFVLTKG